LHFKKILRIFVRFLYSSWNRQNSKQNINKKLKIMASFKGAISVDIERCKGCGVCVVNCPMNVISLAKEVNGKGYNYAYMAEPDKCIGCASCGIVCPDGVISVYKAKL
jgi:2-oxoglutarate ferredoxin oxidoreductase subunit delta